MVPVQVTEEGKVVAVGDGPQGDYLPITGGELTGDLEVDGSGKFKGYVLSGLNPGSSNNNNSGSMISEDGHLVLFHASTSTVGSYLRCHKHDGAGSYDDLTTIKSDGSIWIGGNHISANPSPNITLNADGSASFESGGITLGSVPGVIGPGGITGAILIVNQDNPANAVFLGKERGVDTTRIDSDGSVFFAGGNCGFTADGEIFFTSRNARYKLLVQGELVVAEPYTRQMELKEKAEQFIADKKETKPSQPGVTPDNDNA